MGVGGCVLGVWGGRGFKEGQLLGTLLPLADLSDSFI